MRSLSYAPLFVVGLTLLGWLQLGSSFLYAQNDQLKPCFDELVKNKQALVGNKPNPVGFFSVVTPTNPKRQNWEECVKGHQIPPLSFKTLTGESYDSASLAGKIVVINFWYMACAPCRAELPALNKLSEEYKGKNVLFLGFSTDPADKLKPDFFHENPFTFTIVPDSRSIAQSFYFVGYPTTYVVDGKGIIRDVWSGVGVNKFEPYYRGKTIINSLLAASSK